MEERVESKQESAALTKRNALVESHLYWARRVAKSVYVRLRVPTVDWADYVQAATVGLIEAAGRYDPAHGVSFPAFAIRRVRGEVFNSLRSSIRAAAHHHHEHYDPLSERAASLDSNEFDPLQRVVQLVAGLGVGLVLELQSMPIDPVTPCAAYGAMEREQFRRSLNAAIARLPERERYIVSMHYLQHVPFVDIAESLQVTKGRVSQLHKRAMGRLREGLR